jgi:crossover junction endodeoxyribonuclease RusA
MVTVDLPYPPSTNGLYFNKASGGRAKTVRYDLWRKEAAWRISIERRAKKVTGPYGLTVLVGRPDNRRRDIDNLIKPISDALKHGGAIEDDSECQKLEAEWMPGIVGVRVTVMPTKRRG